MYFEWDQLFFSIRLTLLLDKKNRITRVYQFKIQLHFRTSSIHILLCFSLYINLAWYPNSWLYHVYQDYNTDADAQANLAIYLKSKAVNSFPVFKSILLLLSCALSSLSFSHLEPPNEIQSFAGGEIQVECDMK